MGTPGSPESIVAHRPVPEESYESLYREFDSPVARQVRQLAYGEDIGQHSWVTAEDLRQAIGSLGLSSASRLLDLGCGPAGPLTFIVEHVRCAAVGVELSDSALEAARARVGCRDLSPLIELHRCDLNHALPFADASFTTAMSWDVVLHLFAREATFREVARVLGPGGRFQFTDAAVLTGAISSEQVRWRSIHGMTHFAPEGFNERCLERAGFRLLETQNRTRSVYEIAQRRIAARAQHRANLERLETPEQFEREQTYLKVVMTLAETKSLSRLMYQVEVN